MTTHRTLHLGVDLSGTAARPSQWTPHGPSLRVAFDAEQLVELVATAERGALDLVTIDDTFRLVPDRPTVFDAARAALRLAPATERIGLVPSIPTAQVAPEHVAQALGAIDAASSGRVGWQVGGSGGSALAAPDPLALRSADPVVVLRADSTAGAVLAGHHADVARVAAHDAAAARVRRTQVREAAAQAGRNPDDVRVLVDLGVVVGPSRASAEARTALLAATSDALPDVTVQSVGTVFDVAELMTSWFESESADGFVVRPGSLRADLAGLVDGVVPVLREAGLFRRHYPGVTLRDSLGLRVSRARLAVPA